MYLGEFLDAVYHYDIVVRIAYLDILIGGQRLKCNLFFLFHGAKINISSHIGY